MATTARHASSKHTTQAYGQKHYSSKSHSSKPSSRSSRDCNEIVEERITTSNGEVRTHRYLKSKFLGKGGFAKCYVFTSLETNLQYCGKVVSKATLLKSKAKQKLQAEIKIHKTLSHRHVVRFEHFFEDAANVYIILELCPNYSMSELMRRRKRLTEAETQYYMLQLLDGVNYLHKINVIHRDLKLGNLFLDKKMEVKIGDLGLAAKLSHDNERKRTICGTPNYIAPEILEGKQGHSFQVDIWSIGVILYTFLIGKPPYETNDVKSTYRRIRANMYTFPEHVQISDNAKNLIKRILQLRPEARPSIDEICRHPFFTHAGARIPTSLPTSALTTAPLFHTTAKSAGGHHGHHHRNPLGEVNTNTNAHRGGGGHHHAAAAKGGDKYGRSTGAMMRGGGENAKPGAGKYDAHAHRGRAASTAEAGRDRDRDRQPLAQTARDAGASSKPSVTAARPATARPSSHLHVQETTKPASQQQQHHLQSKKSSSSNVENKENSSAASNQNQPQQWATKPSAAMSSVPSSSTTTTTSTGADKGAGFKTPPSKLGDGGKLGGVGTLENMHQQLAQSFAHKKGADAQQPQQAAPTSSSSSSSAAAGAPQPVSADLEPKLWVTKWVDYTSKYGLGYLLSDGSAGVYFNDSSKIILATDASSFEYMERSSRRNGVRPPDPPRHAHTLESFPAELNKKVTLLKHFRNYLVDQQAKEGAGKGKDGARDGGLGSGKAADIVASGDVAAPAAGAGAGAAGVTSNMPYLKKWVRTRHAILFRLSNRTVQVNFFDHTEILLSSEARLVTYVDRQSTRTTFPLAAVVEYPRADIAKRLKYTKDILHQLISGGHR